MNDDQVILKQLEEIKGHPPSIFIRIDHEASLRWAGSTNYEVGFIFLDGGFLLFFTLIVI
jgi:hypothetical protein